MIDRLIAAMDTWLGPYQYPLGKWYRRRGRLGDALDSFAAAEVWLTRKEGADHPHVVAAIVSQAACQAEIGNQAEACRQYARALRMMEARGESDHPTAKEIAGYLAAKCL